MAVGLRLGASLCEAHQCVCSHPVSTLGHHGLSCVRGFGRQARHGAINDLICRALTKAGYPAIKEPPGLLRTDGKRPDGLTLIPWKAGRCLVWDATVADTFAASYLPTTSIIAGSAAEAAASRKETKYQLLNNAYEFVPLALETMGPINSTGLDFISNIGRNLTLMSGDPRESAFLFQRLSITIQRFNAVAFRGTFFNSDVAIPEY